MFLFLYISQDAIATLPNAGLRLWPGQDPIGGGATPKIGGGQLPPLPHAGYGPDMAAYANAFQTILHTLRIYSLVNYTVLANNIHFFTSNLIDYYCFNKMHKYLILYHLRFLSTVLPYSFPNFKYDWHPQI